MKPSPIQARLLLYFAGHPDLCMRMWFWQMTWMPRETGHKGEIYNRSFEPEERIPKATVASCLRLGWLERITGPDDDAKRYDSENTSYLALSKHGATDLARLKPADFVNVPQPSVTGETARVLRALGARHERPEWVFLAEAPVYSKVKRATVAHIDAFAINCYGSKGFATVGYEVKVSRSDFCRELKQPEKTAQAAQMCSAFYFAAPIGLLKPTEIPDPYGLVNVLANGKSRMAKHSKLDRPAPTWGTLGYLLRRIVGEEIALDKESQ